METAASYSDNKNALYKPDHKDATQFKDWNDWQKLPGERFFLWDKNPHCSVDLSYTKKFEAGYAKLTTSYFSPLHDRSDNGPIGFTGRFVHKLGPGKIRLDADGRKFRTLFDFGTIQNGDMKMNPFVQGNWKINWQPFPGMSIGGENSKMFPGLNLTGWKSRWQVGAVTTSKISDWNWYNVTMAGMAGFKPAPTPVKTTLELANPDMFNVDKVMTNITSTITEGANEAMDEMNEEEQQAVRDANLEVIGNQMMTAIKDHLKSDNENKYSFTCNNSLVQDTRSHNLNTHMVYSTATSGISNYGVNYSFLRRYNDGNQLYRVDYTDGTPVLSGGWIKQRENTVQAFNFEADVTLLYIPYIGFKMGRDFKVGDSARARFQWATDNTFMGNFRGSTELGKVPVRMNLSASYHPSMAYYDLAVDAMKGVFSMIHQDFGFDTMRRMKSISPPFKWGVNVELGDL